MRMEPSPPTSAPRDRASWTLPPAASIANGWGLSVRDDSPFGLILESGDSTPFVTLNGSLCIYVRPRASTSITLAVTPVGTAWLVNDEDQAQLVSELNPGTVYLGTIPTASDLPVVVTIGAFFLVADDGAASGTYQEIGGVWTKVGDLPGSGDELARQLGLVTAVSVGKYVATSVPISNAWVEITHNLGTTELVIQAYDAATEECRNVRCRGVRNLAWSLRPEQDRDPQTRRLRLHGLGRLHRLIGNAPNDVKSRRLYPYR